MLVVIISLQLLILIFGMNTIRSIEYVDTVLNIIDFLLILHVVDRHTNTSYKLIWSIIIYAIPLIGGVIYLMFAERKVPKSLRNEMTSSLTMCLTSDPILIIRTHQRNIFPMV